MRAGRQFRVLYRDFLFSVVDRELLSTHGTGDSSCLLLQIVALLFCLSVCFCLSAFVIGVQPLSLMRLVTAWSVEHFLIAATMLVVGVLAVLSWDRLFPTQRDVLVLGPLPIRAQTILLARICAAATALAVAVAALHLAAGVILPLALTRTSPARPLHVPSFTYDPPLPPVPAAGLRVVLDRDMAGLVRDGPLAPRAGGGLAIGVYQRGVRQVVAYGAAKPDSIFQIASLTKPFTGLLLADMVERGLVGFDDPVRELIPAAGLARPAGREITLLDLVTHRSGLPGMPPGFRWSDRPNPLADFDADRLYAYLRARGLYRRPATSFVYSNIGFGLLGHALSQRAGAEYAALVSQVITAPLAMPDTVEHLSPDQMRRFLQGHNDSREPIPAWDHAVLAGAGGLKSTASDLLTWLEANLHPERVRDTTLAAAIAASQQVRAPINSNLDIGLAWAFDRTSGAFLHTGAILGFTADAFFDPAKNVAVVVLSNIGPGTAWSAQAVGSHVRARLDGRPAVSLAELTVPATGGVRGWLRLLIAYWVTMTAAGLFMFGFVASAQGLLAALAPRRAFVRVSSWLQLASFCAIVGTFVLQPMMTSPSALLAAQSTGLLAWSPSYWFLGMFQQLAGSPAFAPLARTAWIGLGLAVIGTAAAYGLSYARTLQRIAEQPDTVTPVTRSRWPAAGSAPLTALVHFGLKTALRSAQHRVILALYWGLGFALIVFVLKVPRGQQLAEGPTIRGWDETGVPLLLSSIVTMAFAVLAARLAFAMPRDLSANWIFRLVPARSGAEYMAAHRRALCALSVAPVWTAWAVAFLALWPWLPALGHLVLLGSLGLIFVELALIGPLKIPCTCSYLPGKSQLHLVFVAAVLLFVGVVRQGARHEMDALQDARRFIVMLGVLLAIWIALRWRAARTQKSNPAFDEEGAGDAVALGLWDVRTGGAESGRDVLPT